MSERERQRRIKLKYVCRQAAIYLMRTEANRSMAMLVSGYKLKSIIRKKYSKIFGTTYHNRQRLLRKLSSYNEKDIKLYLNRDYGNEYDEFAIEIWASVRGKGSACLGYVGKHLSESMANVLDSGNTVLVLLEDITGLQKQYLGLNYSYIFLP